MQKPEAKKTTAKPMGNITIIAYLVFVLLVAGGALLAKKDLAKFGELRVQGVNAVALTSNPDSLQHIYALLATSTSKFQSAGQVDLDKAFVQPAPEVVVAHDDVVKVVAKDAIKEFLAQVSSIDGISNNGAIINGKFYGVGEIMNDFLQFDGKGGISFEPRIVEIGNHVVVIENGRSKNKKKSRIVLKFNAS